MERQPRISDKSVQEATGKAWHEWFALLDKKGAKDMLHAEIVHLLREGKYLKNSWWCQSVTVEYEYARGKRDVGQTGLVGYEIGAQKMMTISPEEAWDLITSPKGRAIWLGDSDNLSLMSGEKYATKEGTIGEIRTIKPGERIRLSFQPKGWDKPSTLQVTIFCPRNTKDKTNIHFHQEKLPNAQMREQMRHHWHNVLITLEKVAFSS